MTESQALLDVNLKRKALHVAAVAALTVDGATNGDQSLWRKYIRCRAEYDVAYCVWAGLSGEN